jgi:hypothetical protein
VQERKRRHDVQQATPIKKKIGGMTKRRQNQAQVVKTTDDLGHDLRLSVA